MESSDPRCAVEVQTEPETEAPVRPRSRPTDHSWEALVEVTGSNPDMERIKLNVALKAIRSAAFREGLTEDESVAEEIRLRAAAYHAHPTFQNCCLTPIALATHWVRVMAPVGGASTLTAQQIAFQQARASA